MKTILVEKQIKRVLIAALALLSLAACVDSLQQEGYGTEAALPIRIAAGYPTQTRVTEAGFVGGDAIGVYVVDYENDVPGILQAEGNNANNIRFALDEEIWKWTSATNLYFKDDQTPIDVYAYYPFTEKVETVNAFPFVVQTDQNRIAQNGIMAGYEASDLLWAKAAKIMPTTETIFLSFSHLMAGLQITLVEGEGFAEGEWNQLAKDVWIPGIRRNAIVDFALGKVTVQGEVSEDPIRPYISGTDYRAIVVPQAIEAGEVLVGLTVGGSNYELVKQKAVVYESGKKHHFTIQVDKKVNTGKYSFTLIDEAVTAWLEDATLHEGLVREYLVVHVPEAGRLSAILAEKGLNTGTLEALKLTGYINQYDFDYMRDSLSSLNSLNLKDVQIKRVNEKNTLDNAIPDDAFRDKSKLTHFIFPDCLNTIGSYSFYGTHLAGSLIIPEGVREIGGGAFFEISSLKGKLVLPTTLTTIQNSAFANCGFTSDLLIPSEVSLIGDRAFDGCTEMTGTLALPSKLKEIGSSTFSTLLKLSGDLIIPQGIVRIPQAAFSVGAIWNIGNGIDGNIEIPEGVELIENCAFYGLPIKGELKLPRTLKKIGGGDGYGDVNYGAFESTLISGRLILPEGLVSVGDYTFKNCSRLADTLKIPASVPRIGKEAFYGCTGIEAIELPEGLQVISSGAFGYCTGLNSIVCHAKTPPVMDETAFAAVPKNSFSVEVPKGCVDTYRMAPGWREFARITEYRGFVCRPLAVNALNKEHTEDIILNADGAWTVEHLPAWCTLSQTSGTYKTALKLTLKELSAGQANRTDSIVFKLSDGDYRTRCNVSQYNYQYAEDEIVTLQQATCGTGIDILFMGDGFDAAAIADGSYMNLVTEQYRHFFDIEPYRTYKEYFNVYAAIALSQETGVNTLNTYRNTKFNTVYGGCDAKLLPDAELVTAYALNTGVIRKKRLAQSLLVVVPNSTEYGGSTYYYDDGTTISVCSPSESSYPNDTRGIVQHEAGGHGFGKLGDERIIYNRFIPDNMKGEISEAQWRGWYQNISLIANMSEVPWAHLIFDERYSDIVDIFEGAYGYTRAVYRSESNSCMNYGIPYYNTISRQDIVKRILEYAGEEFTLEKFFEKDTRAWGGSSTTRMTVAPWQELSQQGSHKSPTFVRERPSEMINNK